MEKGLGKLPSKVLFDFFKDLYDRNWNRIGLNFVFLCLFSRFADCDFLLALLCIIFKYIGPAEELNAFNIVHFLYVDSIKLTLCGADAAADALVWINNDRAATEASSLPFNSASTAASLPATSSDSDGPVTTDPSTRV